MTIGITGFMSSAWNNDRANEHWNKDKDKNSDDFFHINHIKIKGSLTCKTYHSLLNNKNYKPGILEKNLPTATVSPISKSQEISQTFICPHDNLSKICILGATYKRINIGKLNFILKYNETVLRKVEIDCETLKDNSWFEFSFEPIPDSKNKLYKIVLESSSRITQAITVYYYKTISDFGNLLKNKSKIRGVLAFKTYHLL